MIEPIIDLSNISIPIATLIGASWLFGHENNYGWLILIIGLSWWIIDQIIKWQRMKYWQRHSS